MPDVWAVKEIEGVMAAKQEPDYESMTTEELRETYWSNVATAESYESGRGFVKKYARPYNRAAGIIRKLIVARGEACYFCGGINGWYTAGDDGKSYCMSCHRIEQHAEKESK